MTAPQADRPPRTRPRPAADAGVDPIDYGTRAAPAPTAPVEGKGAPAPAAAPAAVTRPAEVAQPVEAAQSATVPQASGGVEPTVQLATRISLDVNDVLTKAYQRTGKKKRALIEEAILRTWGE